jgi:hypothetical protein
MAPRRKTELSSMQIEGTYVGVPLEPVEWLDEPTRTPLHVEFEWAILAGRAEPVSISISSRDGDRPITREIVGRVPIGGIVADERAKRHAYWETEAATYYPSETDAQRENIARAVEVHSPDARLREVADVYRDAFERGASVQRAVREHFGLESLSGAAKKIAAARARGYLGEAVGTKAGERQPEGKSDEKS